MPLTRFDKTRLAAVATDEVLARRCERADALVRACRLGAGPATRPWWQPWQASRIEWPYGVFHVPNLDVARRACLLLDGSWALQDAASKLQRWQVRLLAQAHDAAWWRPLGAHDAWDAGIAHSVTNLAGFYPRRATLIVLNHPRLDDADLAVLAGLERQAPSWQRAVRLVLAGGQAPAFARPLGG